MEETRREWRDEKKRRERGSHEAIRQRVPGERREERGGRGAEKENARLWCVRLGR